MDLSLMLTTPFVVAIIVTCLYLVYRSLLPRPLSGIPYNHDAANKLFGDVPEMMSYVLRTKRIFCWLTSLTSRHSSPIVQAFITPFSSPWVIISDPPTATDILLRRTKEFDRSGHFGALISGVLPEQHIQFLSSDARFKKNRALINHLMAPGFVKEISAPEVYKGIETLIVVWDLKCENAKGRPFEAHGDITYAALDAIFASSFGLEESESCTFNRLDAVQNSQPEMSHDIDKPVTFPGGKIPFIFRAVLTLAHSVEQTQLSPAPRLTSWVLRQMPYMRRAKKIKDSYIAGKVDECVEILDQKPKSALHSVLVREKQVAEKEGRNPEFHSRAISDEFFGFTLAGHDTAATATAWGVKYLSDHPDSQAKLRDALHVAFPSAIAEHRLPSYVELASTSISYLDAVVEEILRHANTIAFVVRQALVDTTVLGHRIPKGTDVFLMANGAGYLESNLPSPTPPTIPTSSVDKAQTPLWNDSDVASFDPSRWLRADGSFDSMAGPTLAFGLGPRACFGKRLAVQALRMQFALLVWRFRLLKVPEESGGYEAVQKFAREPVRCYVRLERADV
ncbi:cytochrome P450 [Phaeosphaeria sp. MPI-PUGE-AT-0046c]|nr:cytochrome P450 [Phaeosphaeria sp. MPI-PUGE-AT-0046c]